MCSPVDLVNGMTREEWNKHQLAQYYERKKRYKEQGLNSIGKPYKIKPPKKRGYKPVDPTKPRRKDFKTFEEFDNALWRWQKKKAEETYPERMRAKIQAMKENKTQHKVKDYGDKSM